MPRMSHWTRKEEGAVGRMLAFVYGVVGYLEERDIVSVHGAAYEDHRKQVSMPLPIPKKR